MNTKQLRLIYAYLYRYCILTIFSLIKTAHKTLESSRFTKGVGESTFIVTPTSTSTLSTVSIHLGKRRASHN